MKRRLIPKDALVFLVVAGIITVLIGIFVGAFQPKAQGAQGRRQAEPVGVTKSAETTIPVSPVDSMNRVPQRGKEALVRPQNAGGKSTFVCGSEEAYDRFMKSANVGDKEGMMEQVFRGEAASVEEGTRVLILDLGYFKTKVRIRSGKLQGRVAWMRTEDLDGQQP